MSDQIQNTASDERTMAGIAHLFGLVVALIIWATQKDRSRFVRFQAAQAMLFDLMVVVVIFALVGCLMVVMIGGMALGMGGLVLTAEQSSDPAGWLFALMTSIPFLMTCPIMVVSLLIFVCRIVAAVQSFQGRDFRYPWLSKLVERFGL